MKTIPRIMTLATAALVIVIPPIGRTSAPPSEQTTAHIVHGSDEKNDAQIADADAAFRAAGLELPRLEIYVQDQFVDCDGMGGLFNKDGSGFRVDLCSGLQFTVFHEFAHAWEYHQVDDATRIAFMELHGLDTWRSRNASFAERGIETAAETIAKGLQDHPLPEWQCEHAAALDEGYTLLTGQRSPRFAAAVDGRAACPQAD